LPGKFPGFAGFLKLSAHVEDWNNDFTLKPGLREQQLAKTQKPRIKGKLASD